MSTISPDEIVDLIANIRTRHPEVELKLCDANAKELRTRLLAGDLEVAIYVIPGKEPDERIHSIPLFREQMASSLVMPTRFSGRKESPANPSIGASATTGPWLWSPPGWDLHSCRQTQSNTPA